MAKSIVDSEWSWNTLAGGLQQRENAPPAATEHLDRLAALGQKAVKAALKAQFLANMSASFVVDVARLMTTKAQPSTEEKQEFMAQMDSWAENFADEETRKRQKPQIRIDPLQLLLDDGSEVAGYDEKNLKRSDN